jgi:transposase-like protein
MMAANPDRIRLVLRYERWLGKIGLADKWTTCSHGRANRPIKEQQMRRPRRNHTAAFKAKVAVAALKGDKTLAELAEKFDLHANQITQWRAQLLEGATDVFLTPAEKRDTGPTTKDMQAKIGQQALEIDFLAGALGRIGDASAKK